MNWPAGFQLPWQSSRVALATLVTLAYIRLALGEHDHVGSRQRADAARYVGHQVLGDAQVRPPGGVEGGLVVVAARMVGNGFNHQSLDKGCPPLTHKRPPNHPIWERSRAERLSPHDQPRRAGPGARGSCRWSDSTGTARFG